MGGRLETGTFKKIVNSYGIYIPMICDAFSGLKGRKTSVAEKERILLYFICSSLFDDFCDRRELTEAEMEHISYRPASWQPANVNEKIFLHAHLALRDFVGDKDAYDTVTRQLFAAQIDSIRQFDASISDADLHRITLEKGGYAVLLCHFYLDEEVTETEQELWFRLGKIIQLTNDLFDIYKDLADGSQTLPNRMKDAHAFHDRYFSGAVQEMIDHVHQLPYPAKRKQDFMISLMAICSFGRIALKQLTALQGNAPALPALHSVPRKQLIVDMEKAGNILYCMRYTYRQTLLNRCLYA